MRGAGTPRIWRANGAWHRRPMTEAPKPPPDAASLHEAALAHLARYATTRTGLLRVLDRRILRWIHAGGDEDAAQAARAAARQVVDRLVASGLLDDAAFAEARARALTRAGRSRRAVAAHLRARGVTEELTATALPEDAEAEFAAALAYARRRRIGPFRAGEAEAKAAQKELAAMARAGFAQELARRALAEDPDAAIETILRFRQR
jgi:regulatory protein